MQTSPTVLSSPRLPFLRLSEVLACSAFSRPSLSPQQWYTSHPAGLRPSSIRRTWSDRERELRLAYHLGSLILCLRSIARPKPTMERDHCIIRRANGSTSRPSSHRPRPLPRSSPSTRRRSSVISPTSSASSEVAAEAAELDKPLLVTTLRRLVQARHRSCVAGGRRTRNRDRN